MRLALVGMPGSGKSTVGRQLAKRLSSGFLDTDVAFEEREGCSIRAFFDIHGEAAFRDREESLIDELTRSHQGVLATGGGAVLRENNRRRLHDRCTVVYLRASPEDIFRRLRHDKARPLLQVGNPLKTLRDLFALRDPLYVQTAHYVIETGRPSVSTLVNMIQMQLELSGLVRESPGPLIG